MKGLEKIFTGIGLLLLIIAALVKITGRHQLALGVRLLSLIVLDNS